ncbi:MAG: acyl-CoA thioesterase [Verrucomicrobiales bacterium]|nr:acyl-CoA thioesterase [Verrucomicrobiales bacterium]
MENHRLVLPQHLNHYGFLFGGYLLAWVDETAWLSASTEFPDCRFVTVGMNEIEFKKSVREGSILHFNSQRIRIGTTSVTYHVQVFRDETEIFSNQVTMVRVDESGRKQPLPEPQPLNLPAD